MITLSVTEMIDRLYGGFDVILTRWKTAAPTATHLWELSVDKTTAQILEEDVRMIGFYFLSADAIGAQTETYLLAECIASLHAKEQKLSGYKQIEHAIEHIGAQLVREHHPEEHDIHAPLSYRIAQHACAQHLISDEALDAYRQSLLRLSHLFLLRDGNYTSEEDERRTRYDEALR